MATTLNPVWWSRPVPVVRCDPGRSTGWASMLGPARSPRCSARTGGTGRATARRSRRRGRQRGSARPLQCPRPARGRRRRDHVRADLPRCWASRATP